MSREKSTTSWTPERRAAQAERMQKMHSDPAFSEATAKRMRARNGDLLFNLKRLHRLKQVNDDPEFKSRKAELLKQHHSEPDFVAALRQGRERYLDKKWGTRRKKRELRNSDNNQQQKEPRLDIEVRNLQIFHEREQGRTLKQIGEKHSLTSERVRQILKRLVKN